MARHEARLRLYLKPFGRGFVWVCTSGLDTAAERTQPVDETSGPLDASPREPLPVDPRSLRAVAMTVGGVQRDFWGTP